MKLRRDDLLGGAFAGVMLVLAALWGSLAGEALAVDPNVSSPPAVEVICPGCVGSSDIADGSVTLSDEATMAAATVQGRASGAGTGAVTALTGTQLAVIVDPATTSLYGTTKIKVFDHTYYFTGSGSGTAWSNVPSGTVEWLGATWRSLYDSSNFTEIRIALQTRSNGSNAPPANFLIGIECSADGTNWLFVDDGTSAGTTGAPTNYGTHMPAATWAAATRVLSAWSPLHTGCRGDFHWRAVAYNGDGAGDPTAGDVRFQFR